MRHVFLRHGKEGARESSLIPGACLVCYLVPAQPNLILLPARTERGPLILWLFLIKLWSREAGGGGWGKRGRGGGGKGVGRTVDKERIGSVVGWTGLGIGGFPALWWCPAHLSWLGCGLVTFKCQGCLRCQLMRWQPACLMLRRYHFDACTSPVRRGARFIERRSAVMKHRMT